MTNVDMRPRDNRGFPLCECGKSVCSDDYSPDHLCRECWEEEKAEIRLADRQWRHEVRHGRD